MKNNVCKLCQKNKANHKKSHLISAWLFRDSLQTDKGNRIFSIIIKEGTGVANKRPFQDIFYKEFIFCKECEDFFGILERYIKNNFYIPFRSSETFKNQEIFRTLILDNETLTYCEKVNEGIFCLFILCQFWRSTLLSGPISNRFKLSPKTIVNLQNVLYHFKSGSSKELNEKLNKNNITEFRFLIMMLNNDTKLKPQETIIMLDSNIGKNIYWIEINDFKFFLTDDSELKLYKKDLATNSGKEKIKILHISDPDWRNWNQAFLKTII